MPVGRGARFLLNGRSYEITNQLERNLFEANDLEFDVKETFSRDDLLRQLEEGNLEFHVEGKNTSGEIISKPDFEDIDMLSEKVKNDADFRLYVIKPLLNLNVKSLDMYVRERVNKINKEFKKEGKSVSRATVYRWLKDYKESGGSYHSLISSNHKFGSREKRVEKEVEMIIDQVIDQYYLKRGTTSQKTIFELVYHKIDELNAQREAEDRLEHPSQSTVRRRILDRDQYDVTKARKGSKFANDKHKQVNHHKGPEYPLQRVEVDHTKLDLFVVDDENRLPIGRPWVTSVLDVYTRYPLGFYIGFEPPSYTSVMHALHHGISTKFFMKEKYPKVKKQWLAHGIPELLVVDNGKEFHSKHLKDACNRLDIEIMYCPVKVPWYKGAVERYFRTINQDLIHSTQGTTFSNVVAKGDYNPKKNAIIGFNKLLEIFYKWVVDYYTQNHHKGARGIPAKIWKTAFEFAPEPLVPPSKLDWKIMLMKMGTGSIQRTGIRDRHLFYQSQDLRDIQHELFKRGLPNSIKYKYDPTDLSRIYVYNEFKRSYLEVPCTNQDYSYGLNEYTHRILIKMLNDEEKKVNMSELAAAKAELMEMVQEERNKTLKPQQKERVKGTGSNQEWSEQPSKKVPNKSNTIVSVETSEKETSQPQHPLNNKEEKPELKGQELDIISSFDKVDLSNWGYSKAN
ncbi:Mu transposase C-terminal domain-containing protein [Bacillus suaedaesalsae]|uniref:Mu transposase C-terminal domain-containing protein n=1 Tax=Bacillus suaedaesalsae TaxID=2810349 RepID=UPI003211AEBE